MSRKLLAILLAVSLLLCMLSGCTGKQNATTTMSVKVEDTDLDIVVEETEKKKTASTTYEGVPMKCEHLLDTDEYWLYLEEKPIKLTVNTLDDGTIEVFTTSEWKEVNNEVVGQFVLTASMVVPGFITAAKLLIGITIGVTVTKTICLSANALGNVIGVLDLIQILIADTAKLILQRQMLFGLEKQVNIILVMSLIFRGIQ